MPTRISQKTKEILTRKIHNRRNRYTPRATERPTAKLVIVTGKAAGKVYRCDSSRTYLGRARDNHVIIQEPSVSRRHACLERKRETFLLEDLNSTNGTILNRRAIGREFLHHGDKIQIGETVLQFIMEEGNQRYGV